MLGDVATMPIDATKTRMQLGGAGGARQRTRMAKLGWRLGLGVGRRLGLGLGSGRTRMAEIS